MVYPSHAVPDYRKVDMSARTYLTRSRLPLMSLPMLVALAAGCGGTPAPPTPTVSKTVTVTAPAPVETVTPEDTTTASPAPPETPPAAVYPSHAVTASFFYGGEKKSRDNNYQTNEMFAWCDPFVRCFGGVDTPTARQHDGAWPAAFTPKENPFYVALPCSDYNSNGLRPDFVAFAAANIPWVKNGSSQPTETVSVLKNRWVKISSGSTTAYGQWEDTGPFEHPEDNDCPYVFGDSAAKPANKFGLQAGIDVSPAFEHALGMDGSADVTWSFVDQADVPAGPWTEIVTTSAPSWQ